MKSVRFFRLFLFLTLSLGLTALQLSAQRGGGGGGQRGGGGNNMLPRLTQEMTPEERQKSINEFIQKNVMEMAETVEVREDQQEVFVKTYAKYQVDALKVRFQMANAGRDRDKRRSLGQQLQKLTRDLNSGVKDILDQDQFKAFQKKMRENQPQGRGGGGRGR